MRTDAPTTHSGGRSTAALVGDRVYLGDALGMYALNAVTGAKIWRSQDVGPVTQEILSAPAVAGPTGDRVIFAGDLSGKVFAFSAADGTRLWTYQTGALIYGSPAIADGRVYITSSDGYLYAFGLPGGPSAAPAAAIASPVDGSTVPNPGGNVAVTGSASDDTGVANVLVAIHSTTGNTWWNAATGKWQQILTEQAATLASPGATSTWTAGFPAPSTGGSFFVQAEAIDADGQRSTPVSSASFVIPSLGNPPETTITSPLAKSVFHFPNNVRQVFTIPIAGTAVDSGGSLPGIAQVRVSIKNIEHSEYYCGPGGCPGTPPTSGPRSSSASSPRLRHRGRSRPPGRAASRPTITRTTTRSPHGRSTGTASAIPPMRTCIRSAFAMRSRAATPEAQTAARRPAPAGQLRREDAGQPPLVAGR